VVAIIVSLILLANLDLCFIHLKAQRLIKRMNFKKRFDSQIHTKIAEFNMHQQVFM